MTERSDETDAPVRLAKARVGELCAELRRRGYRTIGPRVRDGAIVYDDLLEGDELPTGYIDDQDGGYYRLQHDPDAGTFDYSVGPHSLKNYLFPPQEAVQRLQRLESGWEVSEPETDPQPIAVVGPRACDLHALRIQDRVFLEGPFVDPLYRRRRESLFVMAVNCRRAAATCFCHSMGEGPRVTTGADIVLTELDEEFVVEVHSRMGADLVQQLVCEPASETSREAARNVSESLATELSRRGATQAWIGAPERQQRGLDTTDIRDVLMSNLEHGQWQQVADRCLACGNCTMVCPTCFCSTVQEVTDLTGDKVERQRNWSSCFSSEHSAMSGGVVRPTIKAQYRQWLTHKLASWIDQFGESGCVGCGRCITWCPVGIDLTAEVDAIRGEPS